jgi:hypothetical protein
MAELKDLDSSEEAANWAHQVLRAKNSLTAADAERIEQAFEARLQAIANGTANGLEISQQAKHDPIQSHPNRRKRRRQSILIDKTGFTLPTPRRFVTAITSSLSLSRLVSSAADVPQTSIISDLRSHRHLVAR